MKFINPSVEYWPQEAGMEGMWKQIARATRVCYQSTSRDNETDEEFVKRVVLDPASVTERIVNPYSNDNGTIRSYYNFNKMHGAMLEHGTVYLTIDGVKYSQIVSFFDNNPYSKVACRTDGNYDITTNMRVCIENAPYIGDFIVKPTKNHIKRYTFSVITDIGVTREMNRHKLFCAA